jgi:hypothetical protein
MPRVACPSCGTRLTVTGNTTGRKVRCPCGRTFLLLGGAVPLRYRAYWAFYESEVLDTEALTDEQADEGLVDLVVGHLWRGRSPSPSRRTRCGPA